MHFVDAQGRTERILFASVLQPGLVGPGELAIVPYDRGVFRGGLEERAIGIGFEDDGAKSMLNLILVERALAKAGHEQFPDARGPQRAHRVTTPVPGVEVADDTDPPGIRRPNREAGARRAVNDAQLRAELVVNALLFALAEKVEVNLTERGQKGIRIAGALNVSLMIGDDQIISVNALGLFSDAFEETILVQPFEFKLRL